MGSGKGELLKMLQDRGYSVLSLSDVVREEATKRGLEHSRDNLQRVGNELREQYGAGVMGKRIYEKIGVSSGQHFAVDGIRNPAEIDELNKLQEFQLLGITASDDVLLERVLVRGRAGDHNMVREEVIEKLTREKGIGENENGQQVQKCLDRVNYLIINETTLDDAMKKLDHFLRLLRGEDRPNFHEVFMEIAYAWAKRATCLRRRVGAVIAKDKQQLTAGYNGAPRGVPHCAELGGCLREKLKIPSGQRHEICRGTHAEQNAITQAAKFGINIEGSTLYCNTFPCVICTKMILNAGISTVIYDSDYDDPLSKELLEQQNLLKLQRYEGMKYR